MSDDWDGPRYEYRVETVPISIPDGTPEMAPEQLDYLGERGWELTATAVVKSATATFYFRRERRD